MTIALCSLNCLLKCTQKMIEIASLYDLRVIQTTATATAAATTNPNPKT